MKWYENWIQVFKSGTHTDSAGNTRIWTDDDLDKIVQNYAENGDAPVVLGHPKTDEPAYAWVSALKREGEVLLAKIHRVCPEFANWVESGLYRKISVALSPDLNLRHIGFLGAATPAVKGLCNSFEEDCTFREILMPWNEVAIAGDEKKKEEKMAKKLTEQEFTQKIESLEKELEFSLKSIRQKDFSVVLDKLQSESKISAEDRAYLEKILQVLASSDLGEFSESAEEFCNDFVKFLSNLPKRCEFGEFATNKKAPGGTYRTPQEELGMRIATSL